MVDPRVTPATVHGATNTSQMTDAQVRQVNENIAMVYPDMARFFALLTKLQQVSDGKNNKYEWMQQADEPRRVTVQGTTAANGTLVAAGGVALFIAETSSIVAGDVLIDERSDENMIVISNTAGAVIVHTRGAFGTAVPLTIPAGTTLMIAAATKGEHAGASDPKGVEREFLYNYFQTCEEDIDLSNRVIATLYYGTGQEATHQEKMQMTRFKNKFVRSCFRGQRGLVTLADGQTWLMRGLEEWIRSVDNVHDVGGTLTRQRFTQIMDDHARVAGGGLYWIFTSARNCSIMREMQTPFQRSDMNDNKTAKLGLTFDKFVGGGWEGWIMPDESFEESDVYSRQMMVVHPQDVILHTMRGLGLTMNRDIRSPQSLGDHFHKHQLTATYTMEVPVPEAHCLIDGIDA